MELSNYTSESLDDQTILSMPILHIASERHAYLRIITKLQMNYKYYNIKL